MTRPREVGFTKLDGTVGMFDPSACQQFRPGRYEIADLGDPLSVPEAPDHCISGGDGRYFAWTRWGDPGMTARSAARPTPREAYEDLAEAIRAVRELMGRGEDPPP